MLSQGTKAPSFQLESSEGGKVSLAALAGKVVVLYFYPRDNTPGCTLEAQDFRDHHADFLAAGAAVFGISRDSIASHCKFRDKYGLPFPLLSDGEGAMMTAYQAWGEKVMYGKKVTGVIRSTAVIGRDGKLARHWPKVNVKGHAAEVLAFVRALGGGSPASPGGKNDGKNDDKDDGKSGAKARAAKPAAKKSVAKKPAAKKPVARKPVARKPVARKPFAKKPAARKPVAKKPAAKKPAARKPGKRRQ